MNVVSAMQSGSAKLIEKVRVSRYFESPETDLNIAENDCCIDYANTCSSTRFRWLSKSEIPHCATSDDECQELLELNPGVARSRLLIMWIPTWVPWIPTILRLLATVHKSRWMDYCAVCHGAVEAIPILDPVDFKEAYSHIAWGYRNVQWYVRLDGRSDASFG